MDMVIVGRMMVGVNAIRLVNLGEFFGHALYYDNPIRGDRCCDRAGTLVSGGGGEI